MSDLPSEPFRSLPNHSANFGTIPQDAETFRTVRNDAESKESHTLTVREAARMFEAAGVARTERSIINWCHPNKQGVARLGAYFDPNERKYFITPQSVELAIKEEQAKVARNAEGAESAGNLPNHAEKQTQAHELASNKDVRALQQEITDLKITNRAKDYFIEQLQNERRNFVEKLMISNRRVGELETKLLQMQPP